MAFQRIAVWFIRLLRPSGAFVEKHVVQLVHVGPVHDSHAVGSWAEFHVADATFEVLAHHDCSTWRWFWENRSLKILRRTIWNMKHGLSFKAHKGRLNYKHKQEFLNAKILEFWCKTKMIVRKTFWKMEQLNFQPKVKSCLPGSPPIYSAELVWSLPMLRLDA